MAYAQVFYGEQPGWTGKSRYSTHYAPTIRPAGWQSTALVLHVPLCCENCVQKIRKALSKDEEVESVDVDMDKSKVIVNGYVNPERILRKIRKVKKSATFWDSSYDYSTHASYGHTTTPMYSPPLAHEHTPSYPNTYEVDYSPNHRTAQSYDYNPRSSYYEYSRDSPNARYNSRRASSYDAYRNM